MQSVPVDSLSPEFPIKKKENYMQYIDNSHLPSWGMPGHKTAKCGLSNFFGLLSRQRLP